MMFGLVLFVIVYGFLVWLYAPPVERDGHIAVVTTKPIEQQLKDVLWDEEEQVTDKVKEVDKKQTVEELLDGVEVNKITLRKARKIASVLGIKQKVNKKDQPKAWLVAQIVKKLEANPVEVAPIIVKVVKAKVA